MVRMRPCGVGALDAERGITRRRRCFWRRACHPRVRCQPACRRFAAALPRDGARWRRGRICHAVRSPAGKRAEPRRDRWARPRTRRAAVRSPAGRCIPPRRSPKNRQCGGTISAGARRRLATAARACSDPDALPGCRARPLRGTGRNPSLPPLCARPLRIRRALRILARAACRLAERVRRPLRRRRRRRGWRRRRRRRRRRRWRRRRRRERRERR